ncbi:MAG TPA: glycosyltransferase family 2 protein [Anaerolineae bacterium]|nr:glycosyltransferase family 2 protein [Anaerolineae bacterium]
MKEEARISVIIPTFNRAHMLKGVIDSYLQFPQVYELLIVNDGSTDDTESMINQLAQNDARIKLINHDHNQGMTFARNTGIQHAQGNLILISEDDLALADNSLDILIDHMEAENADVIAGRRIWMRIGESRQEALDRAHQRGDWPVVNRRFLEHNSHAITPHDEPAHLVNATMLIRREVLNKVQYANCYPGNAWREDSDFQLTVQQHGFKLIFCPHALFFHYDRPMAGRGRDRFTSDLRYLYWIYHNNKTFLRRHKIYLKQHIPESLLFNSPTITSIIYTIYRGLLLFQTELRRIWLSRQHSI